MSPEELLSLMFPWYVVLPALVLVGVFFYSAMRWMDYWDSLSQDDQIAYKSMIYGLALTVFLLFGAYAWAYDAVYGRDVEPPSVIVVCPEIPYRCVVQP